MAGSGFSNNVMFALNVCFDGSKTAQVLADGQLLIGSTVYPNIRVGTLASAGGTVTITNGAGAINLETGGAVAARFHTTAGDAIPVGGILNIINGNNIFATGGANNLTINVSGTTNHCVQVGNATGSLTSLAAATNGQLVIGSTGADPVIANLTAGAGISITNAAGSITITNTGAGATWNFTAANIANMTPDNGYICIAPGGALTLGLPAVAAQGTELEVSLDGATSWQITQAANQQIRFGNQETTLGAGGSLTSTAQGDTVRMLCVTANLRWVVISAVGNITVV